MDWKDYSFVRRSELRLTLLKSLATKEKTPSQLKDELKKSIALISRYLIQLKNRGIVKTLTGDERMWKIYAITQKGDDILTRIKNEFKSN